MHPKSTSAPVFADLEVSSISESQCLEGELQIHFHARRVLHLSLKVPGRRHPVGRISIIRLRWFRTVDSDVHTSVLDEYSNDALMIRISAEYREAGFVCIIVLRCRIRAKLGISSEVRHSFSQSSQSTEVYRLEMSSHERKQRADACSVAQRWQLAFANCP
ncbi:unnamed protein product [Phytophthora lilii]|uniref:Unnamed protein product n=1 Tax=Phytophthora lilii TaxID=2077276 RepID=A0A9W6TSA4_9STRA|nr:unnamed protein product [Phytophthora lilii]